MLRIGQGKTPLSLAQSWTRNIILAVTYRLICWQSHISRFCELYQRWRAKLDVVLRQEHTAGEKMFVDWAGATIPVYDRHTGEAWQAPLFVATLGASSYTFAGCTRDQQMESWLRMHVRAFEHFGGI